LKGSGGDASRGGVSDDFLKLEDKAGAAEAIRRMGEEDLLFLNHVIVDRLKLIAQARSTSLMASFGVGDRVKFLGHNGETVTGTIQRLNKKTATIIADTGIQWKVYPGFLKFAK
jgi:hypothetical protein